MISYSYRCLNCNTVFHKEARQIGVIPKNPKCPNCKKKNTRKIILPVAISFQGSGFTRSISTEE